MKILRSVATTATAIAATALPAAFAVSSLSLSSSSSPISKSPDLRFLSPKSSLGGGGFGLMKSFSSAPSAVVMDSQKTLSQGNGGLPELLTEFMVDMKCEGCVKAVESKLETVEGVKRVEADLGNQVVRILGSLPVKSMEEALEQTGRKARLIGQGVPEDFLVSAAVAEFKGPDIFGVVRLAQANMELARIEANFSGLAPGKHGWAINEFGDLTRGPAGTGKIYNPPDQANETEPVGDLGTLEADEKGEAYYSGTKKHLKIINLIGRSVVVYETEDKSDSGLQAAVIARSAGVGENYKKICTCDGTTIWEATNRGFATSKDLFVAGTDTTASTLEWAMAELLHNPDKLNKAKAELNHIIGNRKPLEESNIIRFPYLQAVVKETLRLHPSVPFLVPRKVEANVELGGFTVPKNAQVLVNVWAIGKDPSLWQEPTKFEPERFMGREMDLKGRGFELIPFGAGRRICPGMPLAIRMVPLMVGSLIHNFEWKLEVGIKPEEMNMEEKFGFTLEKAQPLKAIPIPL